MSNRYRFEKLKNSALDPDDDKSHMFFNMLDTIRHGYVEHTFESALELEHILADKEYYIAHKLILTKGKKQLFKGELVKSSKKEILKFLEFSVATDDLRDLLIAPVTDGQYECVIHITEDATYIYSKSKTEAK